MEREKDIYILTIYSRHGTHIINATSITTFLFSKENPVPDENEISIETEQGG
jgi:hypothetical protein